jgi:hypothetical protein
MLATKAVVGTTTLVPLVPTSKSATDDAAPEDVVKRATAAVPVVVIVVFSGVIVIVPELTVPIGLASGTAASMIPVLAEAGLAGKAPDQIWR